MPSDDEPLSKRERERLRRAARRERQRRADAAVARRHARGGDSPLRVLGALLALLLVLGGLVGVYLASRDDNGAAPSRGGATTATGAAAPGPAQHPVTLTWVGDITLGSNVAQPPDQGRPLFAGVRSVLRRADLTIGNLEGTLSAGGAPPDNAAGLQGAGFDVMSLANDHAYDLGAAGQSETIHALDRYGIEHTGRPGAVTMVTVRGVRIALVGFAPFAWSNRMADPAAAAQLVQAADDDADLVVVVMHARGEPIEFAHAVVDAGADLVLGSGGVVRGIERYHDRLIAYSLGRFAGWQSFTLGGNRSLSGILDVRLASDGRLLAGRWHSVLLQGPGTPALDPANASARLVNRLSRQGFTGVYRIDAAGNIRG